MFLYKSNILLKTFYPNFIWDINTKSRIIYLTFDDGPIPEITEFVLETLQKYNAKATFFCIGENVSKNQEIFTEILSNGHSIGNHTMNHINGWNTDFQSYINNFMACQNVMPHNNLFRPPYGKIKNNQAKIIQNTHQIVMWDVLSGDFSVNISPETCLKKSIQYSEHGTIIVFHDSIKAFPNMQYTLPRYIEHFKDKGYKFEPLIL